MPCRLNARSIKFSKKTSPNNNSLMITNSIKELKLVRWTTIYIAISSLIRSFRLCSYSNSSNSSSTSSNCSNIVNGVGISRNRSSSNNMVISNSMVHSKSNIASNITCNRNYRLDHKWLHSKTFQEKKCIN